MVESIWVQEVSVVTPRRDVERCVVFRAPTPEACVVRSVRFKIREPTIQTYDNAALTSTVKQDLSSLERCRLRHLYVGLSSSIDLTVWVNSKYHLVDTYLCVIPELIVVDSA